MPNKKRIIEIIKNKNKNDNSPINKARRRFEQKKNIIIKNKFHINKEKNLNNKYFKKNLDNNLNKFNIEDEESSNDIIKILIFFIIIGVAIYLIVTKYLCVGFIKVNDNQIIEFNNNPNTIEVI